MLQFDVNISILLKEVSFLERFERAVSLGFGAVEFWWPDEENLVAVAEQLQATGLQVALMNFDAGNMAGGAQLDLVRENLAWAADRAGEAGLGVVVESLNSFENPRYLLTNTRETLQLLDELNRPNLKYQYDMYHMQRMEGNLIDTLRKNIGKIGHIQVADSPDRHEPGTGEIHYVHVLAALDTLGYWGYVGLEYNAIGSSEESFAWLPPNRRRSIAVSELRL